MRRRSQDRRVRSWSQHGLHRKTLTEGVGGREREREITEHCLGFSVAPDLIASDYNGYM